MTNSTTERTTTNNSLFPLFTLLAWMLPVQAQINFVPNPSFEQVSDCNLEYGEIFKAPPWKIVEEIIPTSPDLFHACSSNTYFETPQADVYPQTGSGMAGLVNLIQRERIYARLTNDLPADVDIYVAYSVRPRARGNAPMNLLCYSNTQSLVFADLQLQTQILVLDAQEIIDNPDVWTTLSGCYRASGNEKMVLIGDFKPITQVVSECDFIDSHNFSYYYVDDVIVSPFDVVPDTVYICGDTPVHFDISFYDLPIRWSDGVLGGSRTIDQPGEYFVEGNTGDCTLLDKTIAVYIPNETASIELSMCEGQTLVLEAPVNARWPDGSISPNYSITRAGRYYADLLNDCGKREIEFTVAPATCDIQYYVPNAFSPNRDGINDYLEFFFTDEFTFSGNLSVFDRWGNQVFTTFHESTASVPKWDGTFRDTPLAAGVYVWHYQYTSGKDNVKRTIYGDVLLLK
ncbi:MAG: gliding motility-associated C-terminal domain-containing protein [Saprospiraceae bacterium]